MFLSRRDSNLMLFFYSNNFISSQVMLESTVFYLVNVYTGGYMSLITARQRHHLLPKIGPSQHQLHLLQLMDAEQHQIWAYNFFGFFFLLEAFHNILNVSYRLDLQLGQATVAPGSHWSVADLHSTIISHLTSSHL